METITSEQFVSIFLQKRPLLDVRAEVEFSKGSFPNATNLPILNNSERGKVGHCYKHKGPEAAVELGNQLVSGEIKEKRLNNWTDFIRNNPDTILYCFRGGMRSRLTQKWLEQAGCKIPRIEGGYKALRNFLLNTIKEYSEPRNFIVVGGRTGTGKTRVITAVQPSLDLEDLANHRGSAFGKIPQPQPQQINFENTIAIGFLQLFKTSNNQIILEDESKLIGRNALPLELKSAMNDAQLVVVNEPLSSRIKVVIDEYVSDLHNQYKIYYQQKSSEETWELYKDVMYQSLSNIQKKIGAVRYKSLVEIMNAAFTEQERTGSKELHAGWIAPLLTDYYDKMYDYQLDKKQHRIIFQGNREEIIQYLNSTGRKTLNSQ